PSCKSCLLPEDGAAVTRIPRACSIRAGPRSVAAREEREPHRSRCGHRVIDRETDASHAHGGEPVQLARADSRAACEQPPGIAVRTGECVARHGLAMRDVL